jgi:hypothetical protein
MLENLEFITDKLVLHNILCRLLTYDQFGLVMLCITTERLFDLMDVS